MKVNKIEVDDNLHLHFFNEDKFNTTSITFVFRSKLSEENYYKMGLLNLLLTTASQNYPSLKSYKDQKVELYDFKATNFKLNVGEYLNLVFSFNFIESQLISSKNYLKEVYEFIFETIFRPYAYEGKFEENFFNKQKELAINHLKANAKDKIIYFQTRMARFFDGVWPLGLNYYNNIEKLEEITSKEMYEFYQEVIKNELDIFIIGKDAYRNNSKFLLDYFKNFKQKSIKLNSRIDLTDFLNEEIIEESDFQQSTLCLRYSFSLPDNKINMVKKTLFNYYFGSGSSSRLFKIIREQHGLCYSIFSKNHRDYDLLDVFVFHDVSSYEKIKSLIDKEISKIIAGEIDIDVLKNNKELIISELEKTYDTHSGIIASKIVNNIKLREDETLEALIKTVESISSKDIIECAKSLKLKFSYLLKQSQEIENEETRI